METTSEVSLYFNLYFLSDTNFLVNFFVARKDIDDLLARMSKAENQSSMAAALGDASMSDNSVDLILKAINDMQDKINKEVDEKLVNYVQVPTADEILADVKSMNRRVVNNEGELKNIKELSEANTERAENIRKKTARLQTDLDALKGMTSSQP